MTRFLCAKNISETFIIIASVKIGLLAGQFLVFASRQIYTIKPTRVLVNHNAIVEFLLSIFASHVVRFIRANNEQKRFFIS